MPDQAGVEAALAAAVSEELYPDGLGADSVVGAVCRVFPGWPVAAAVEGDALRGVVQVGVVGQPETVKDTTRFLPVDGVVVAAASAVSVRVDGGMVVLNGVAAPGQLVGVRVDGRPYVWRVQAGEDLNDVAVGLAGLVGADRACLRAGTTLSMPGGRDVVARSVVDTAVGTELRRQTMVFRVMVWAPAAGLRDRVSAVVEAGLAERRFLDVGGWACWVRGAPGVTSDKAAAAGLWRRDLGVVVEFPTVREAMVPAMLFGVDVVGARVSVV